MEDNINREKTLEELEQVNNVEDATEIVKKLENAQVATNSRLNRAQRRALTKKLGKNGRAQADLIMDTTEKLNYIDLIQKLRELNKKKENEENETAQDGNTSI